jgi:hypothetical protein
MDANFELIAAYLLLTRAFWRCDDCAAGSVIMDARMKVYMAMNLETAVGLGRMRAICRDVKPC